MIEDSAESRSAAEQLNRECPSNRVEGVSFLPEWEFVPHADLHSQPGIMSPRGAAHKWVMHPNMGWSGDQTEGQKHCLIAASAPKLFNALVRAERALMAYHRQAESDFDAGALDAHQRIRERRRINEAHDAICEARNAINFTRFGKE